VSIDARRREGSLRAARRPRVELPPIQSEQLRVPKLLAIGAASMTAGLALVLALASRNDAPARAERSAAASHTRPIDRAPEPASVETPRAIAVASTSPTPRAPEAAPAVAAEPTVAAPTALRDEPARLERVQPVPPVVAPAASAIEAERAPPVSAQPDGPAPEQPAVATEAPRDGARVKIEVGQVAYLRCDGLAPKKRGPFPCPRDRALEKTLRSIVETLDGCRLADALGRGRFELRLELTSAGARPDLEVRAPSEAGERAVRACAGAALARVTTVLRPSRMIVAQRFNVR
jgi:hypothetical protein